MLRPVTAELTKKRLRRLGNVYFKAIEWVHLASRDKWVAMIDLTVPLTADEMRLQHMGSTIHIDGLEYRVIGVEGFATLRPQRRFGFLVDGEPPKDWQ